MISFQDLMKGFGVVTVMNACIYKLAPGASYNAKSGCVHQTSGNALTPFDFECTHLYIDTLKIANLTQEGPTKTITGGQYSNPLLKYGKTMTLEMQNALGSAEVLKTFFGCDYDEESGVLSVTDKFPSPFAIEGETFFIDQKTGQKKKVWIFIPYFISDGILNLTQDAEGDAAVFDCNGSVGIVKIKDDKHPNGHDIFYHIAEKPWLRFGYMITPDTILDYRLKEDNTYEVAGLLVDEYDGDIVIPSIHKGKRVTSIGDWAFGRDYYSDAQQNINCSIHNVYIPSSVTKIGEFAFSDQTKLECVHFGGQSNLHIICYNAFHNAVRLKKFTIPETVNYIGEGAFFATDVCSWDHLFCYVDKWLVGCDSQADDGVGVYEFEPFRSDTIGIAEYAIPEVDNKTPPWLPESVQHVCRQSIGACNGIKAYNGSSSQTWYAGYLCKEPKLTWDEADAAWVCEHRPVALVCLPRSPVGYTMQNFIRPVNLNYLGAVDVDVEYQIDNAISMVSSLFLDGSAEFDMSDYEAVRWNYNAISIDDYSDLIRLIYSLSSKEAEADGAPWIYNINVIQGRQISIEVLCADGATLIYDYYGAPLDPP